MKNENISEIKKTEDKTITSEKSTIFTEPQLRHISGTDKYGIPKPYGKLGLLIFFGFYSFDQLQFIIS